MLRLLYIDWRWTNISWSIASACSKSETTWCGLLNQTQFQWLSSSPLFGSSGVNLHVFFFFLESPPNKQHRAKHLCSWNLAPLIVALGRSCCSRCCVKWLWGGRGWRPGRCWSLPWSLPEAAASQQSHCLQCKHLSLLQLYFVFCFFFCCCFLIIPLSFQCLSLILHYADLHTSPLLLCIHALSTYLSVMRLWERHYAYAKSIFHSVRMLSWCHWDRFTRVLWSLSGTACMGNMGCGIWRYSACCLMNRACCCLSLRAEGLTKQRHLIVALWLLFLNGVAAETRDRKRVWRQGRERRGLWSRKRKERIEYTAVRWMSGLFAEEEILTERGGNQSMWVDMCHER